MRELELKLAVGDTFVLRRCSRAETRRSQTIKDLPELELGSTYYDTADLRLARSGVTLRYRIGERADRAGR